jgi:hypothetical protein
MMTAPLPYGYSQGVHSSRRPEKACEERVDFMAVTGMSKPDHSCIGEFRRRHRVALQGLFAQVLRVCREAGPARPGHVSLDGTKVKANASRPAAMGCGGMLETERRLKEEVDGWPREAEAADDREEGEHGRGRRGDEMPERVKTRERKLEKIREAKARLEAAAREEGEEPSTEPPAPDPRAQGSSTDPESRIRKTRDGFRQRCNGQAMVDADSRGIVAGSVAARQNDQEERVPMLEAVMEHPGGLEERGVRGTRARGRRKHGTPSATDARRKGPWTRRMRERRKRAGWRSRYRPRRRTVEPVFGQVRHPRGFRRFLARGLEMVNLE